MAIQHADDKNFEELIKDRFVLVDFYGTTCNPCKIFSKVLEDVVAEVPFVNIVKLNTTDYPEIAKKYEVKAVPTIQFYTNGTLRETRIGVMPAKDVKDVISKYLYEE